MRLVLVGGTHDGEEHEYIGPSLGLVKRGLIDRQWVGYVAEDSEPTPFPQESMEMYVATTILYNGGTQTRQIYLEVETRAEAIRCEEVARMFRERARDFAAEAAREDCDPGVNRVFSNWAYAAILDAQIAEAKASALYQPRPRPVDNPPSGGETLH